MFTMDSAVGELRGDGNIVLLIVAVAYLRQKVPWLSIKLFRPSLTTAYCNEEELGILFITSFFVLESEPRVSKTAVSVKRAPSMVGPRRSMA